MSTKEPSTVHTLNFDQLYALLVALAQQFPHRAICSTSTGKGVYFYNVYFIDGVEAELDTIEITALTACQVMAWLCDNGYTTKILPKNQHGFAQATISYAASAGSEQQWHCLSGEAGTWVNAVLALFCKHMLITRENGDWAFTLREDRGSRRLR